jgi:hypothetical protein
MKKPLVLTPQATKICYCVPIPLKVFQDRCLPDRTDMDQRTYKYLMDRLPKGIDAVDFDGHFGPNVFFNAENDTARDEFVKLLHECLTISKRQIPLKWLLT